MSILAIATELCLMLCLVCGSLSMSAMLPLHYCVASAKTLHAPVTPIDVLVVCFLCGLIRICHTPLIYLRVFVLEHTL
jgi:hypothetical protein